MQQIAAWLAGARHRPILVAAALFLLPLLMPLAAALMAFVTLLKGPREGAVAALGAAGVLGLLGWIAGGAAMATFTMALVVLLAVVAVSALMRATASMSLAFQAAVLAAAGLAGVLAVLWQGGAGESFGGEFMEFARSAGVAEAEAQALSRLLAELLFGMALGGLLLSVMIALALGCWLVGWAQGRALLGPQFRNLSTGRVVTVVATLAVIAALLPGGGWAVQACVVFLAAFLLQGLAVVHARVAGRQGHPMWLAAIYGLLLVPTPLAPMAGMSLTAVGYLDNWMGLRGGGARQAPPPRAED